MKDLEEISEKTDETDYIAMRTFNIDQSAEESSDLHEMSICLAQETYAKAANNEALEGGSINSCVDKIANQLILDNNFSLISVPGTEGDYLNSHAVNVCILSMQIGISIGYDGCKLTELGMSAFLHDIGMIKYLDLVRQPRKLTMQEYIEIKNHPIFGAELLKKAKNIPDKVIAVALQQHERMDGSGYPLGLKGEYIDQYARILNLADTYDALTQARSFRNQYEPNRAMKEILSLKTYFDDNIIKAFINTVGMFPVGSLVRLNNGEIGRVIRNNTESPTRPELQILYDYKNQEPEKMKVIDLQKHPIFYITKCLKDIKS